MLQKNVLDAKYMKTLKTAFAEVMGFDVAITVVAEEQNQPKQEQMCIRDREFSPLCLRCHFEGNLPSLTPPVFFLSSL